MPFCSPKCQILETASTMCIDNKFETSELVGRSFPKHCLWSGEALKPRLCNLYCPNRTSARGMQHFTIFKRLLSCQPFTAWITGGCWFCWMITKTSWITAIWRGINYKSLGSKRCVHCDKWKPVQEWQAVENLILRAGAINIFDAEGRWNLTAIARWVKRYLSSSIGILVRY